MRYLKNNSEKKGDDVDNDNEATKCWDWKQVVGADSQTGRWGSITTWVS